MIRRLGFDAALLEAAIRAAAPTQIIAEPVAAPAAAPVSRPSFKLRLYRRLASLPKLGRLVRILGALWRLPDRLDALLASQARLDVLEDWARQMNAYVTHEIGQLQATRPDHHTLTRISDALYNSIDLGQQRLAKQQQQVAEQLYAGLGQVQQDLSQALGAARQADRRDWQDLIGARSEVLAAGLQDLRRQLAQIARPPASLAAAATPIPATAADPALDLFYLALEDRFRGTPALIAARQQAHLGIVRQAVAATAKPVLDLGCGRGEFLALLAGAGIAARGIDLNRVAVAEAQGRGVAAETAEAVGTLAALPDASLGAITAFHLIEHLPLAVLLALLRQAFRVLAPGGVLLLETPNPGNLVVATENFWLDPTHQRPIPPLLGGFLLEYHGFARVAVTPLNPVRPITEADDELTRRLVGAMDYAISGWV